MDKDVILLELRTKLTELALTIEVQAEEIGALKRENADLRERLAKYGNPKNSRNSSIPPSKDENRPRKNQGLRGKTGKRPGGQPGRKGRTLEMTSAPDQIIDLVPQYCNNCGASLADALASEQGTRQIVDIPPIKALWTQYTAYGKRCGCGECTVADFPQGVDAPVSYGGNIEALIGYFHARQYLPFARMKETINDVFNIAISEGGLHCLLNRFADRATPFYEMIKHRVANAMVVGTDETGAKVNGDKHWFWTWQNPQLTYIAHSGTRGRSAIGANFPKGFPNATLVRDGWRAQTATKAKYHQTCLPHLLRQLNYLNEKYVDNEWSKNFQGLLYDAMDLYNNGKQKSSTAKIIQRLDRLLGKPPNKGDKELYTFYKRICRERQHLFTFLFVENVPPDNNASERAIRNIKVKQKISGQFKTEKAAQNFAKIRSVIDTTIKNGNNVLEALALITKLQPQTTN